LLDFRLHYESYEEHVLSIKYQVLSIKKAGVETGMLFGRDMSMNDPEQNPEIPKQQQGGKTGAEHHRTFDSEKEAHQFFEDARRRYLHINNWGKLSGAFSATFQLCDKEGEPQERDPQEGDLIKIDLPGPGPSQGGGFDWVRIEKIADRPINNSSASQFDEYFVMVTRPTPAPGTDQNKVAHFYKDAATSSFILQRKGTEVVASEEGRNEKFNTEDSPIPDKIRNAVVGIGAQSGVSYLQWKALVKGVMGE
jgi:hypothetical protein